MPIEASGPVSLPLENLRVLLSNCEAFREWTGDDTAEAAREHVHLVDLPRPADRGGYTPEELAELRPFAVIDEFALDDGRPGADAWATERDALGGFVDSGKLLLRFEAEILAEDADDPADSKLLFYNRVGAVLQDMKLLGGGDTEYLSIHRMVRYHPAKRMSFERAATQGDVYEVTYVVWWGV